MAWCYHEGQVVPMTTATVDPSGGAGVATFTVSEDALELAITA